MLNKLAMMAGQQKVLYLAARQAPFGQTLNTFPPWIESMRPDPIAAARRFEPSCPSLSLYLSRCFAQRFLKTRVGANSVSYRLTGALAR